MNTNPPLPRTVFTTAAALLAAITGTVAPTHAASDLDPAAPPSPDAADLEAPKVRLGTRSVRLPSEFARVVRVPVISSESVRIDARASGTAGRSRAIDTHRRGRSTVAFPVRRRTALVRSFDTRKAATLRVRIAATDADGNRTTRAAMVKVLPPIGYVPSDQLTTPLPGVAVSSGFGHRWGRRHKGIDLGAPSGTPIRAAAPGRVSSTGWMTGYGKRTVLDHGRLDTVYAHQSRITVRPGQRVRRGQMIGRVGNTGRSYGSHLHFEVRVRGRAVNPLRWLRGLR